MDTRPPTCTYTASNREEESYLLKNITILIHNQDAITLRTADRDMS